MTKQFLTITHLYPLSMNTYGDSGNMLTLTKRCQWRGIEVRLDKVEVGDKYDFTKTDLVFAGGGQDRNQERIAQDIMNRKNDIFEAVFDNIIFLTICGTYQLFGHYFKTHENTTIPGIGIFDAYTVASSKRKIGNVVINHTIPSLTLETFVGFENHSGNTYLKQQASNFNHQSRWDTATVPLGKVVKGFGNNGEDGYEGARYKNCFGTYLHGPFLPKNPHFADYLIQLALERKFQHSLVIKIDDHLEYQTHSYLCKM